MKKVSKKLIFLCFILVLYFAIGELIVRTFYKQLADYNMEQWRYSSELKQPLAYAKLPFHHFSNRQGWYYGVYVMTNSFGFRDCEYSVAKPPNTKRIIFLGDSFTFGWGVPLENTCPKQLEGMLNEREARYEVINTGTGNYNSTMEVELFKLKGLQFNPDLVILMFFVNDTEIFHRASLLKYSILKRSYLLAFLWDYTVRAIAPFNKNLKWEQYYKNLYSAKNLKGISSNRESLKELIHICRDKKIKLLIVNIPELHSLKNYPFGYATEYIKNLVRQNGVPFLDLLPALRSHQPESLWVSRADPHANSKANSLIAKEIYTKIIRDRLI